MAYRSKPTREQTRDVCAYVRAGAYPKPAAEAAGIPGEEFDRWAERAQRPRAPKEIREFIDGVRAAGAHARIRAEFAVFEKDPKTWLKNGPGKEVVGRPGWTTTAPPCEVRGSSGNALDDPAWSETVSLMLAALKDFPDARAAMAEALASGGVRGQAVE